MRGARGGGTRAHECALSSLPLYRALRISAQRLTRRITCARTSAPTQLPSSPPRCSVSGPVTLLEPTPQRPSSPLPLPSPLRELFEALFEA